MYKTNEYSTLKNLEGGADIQLTPNEEFNPFRGNFKVINSANIYKDNKFYMFLEAGQVIEGIGEVQEKITKKVKKVLNLEPDNE